MDEYAHSIGLDGANHHAFVVQSEDLEAWDISVTARNLVNAELAAKAMRPEGIEPEAVEPGQAQDLLRIINLVKWVNAGRPAPDEDGRW